MNTFPLNGTGLDDAIRYATSAGLAGQVDMLFIVSNQNQVPMVGEIDLSMVVAGQISSQVVLTADPASMAFTVSGDGLFNNTFLNGTATMSFDMTGNTVILGQLQGQVVMSFDAVAALSMVGFLTGESDMGFDIAGVIRAIRFLDGNTIIGLDLAGDLSTNPSADDDIARTFRRAFNQREFRR